MDQPSVSGAVSQSPMVSADLERAVLRTTANLVSYGESRREIQTAVQTSGLLDAILSRCATNFDNPLSRYVPSPTPIPNFNPYPNPYPNPYSNTQFLPSREWALLAVRNVTATHDGIRQYVSSLGLQGTLESDDLKRRGLGVEVDSTQGKFKFVQRDLGGE